MPSCVYKTLFVCFLIGSCIFYYSVLYTELECTYFEFICLSVTLSHTFNFLYPYLVSSALFTKRGEARACVYYYEWPRGF